MAIVKVSVGELSFGLDNDAFLAAGEKMAMRIWKNEQPMENELHRSPYEALVREQW